MKKAFLLILILVSFNLKAITWEIIGPCQIEPLYKGQLHLKSFSQNVNYRFIKLNKYYGFKIILPLTSRRSSISWAKRASVSASLL